MQGRDRGDRAAAARAAAGATAAPIAVWLGDPQALAGDPELARQCAALLDRSERARHGRLARAEDARHFAAAHALLRVALSAAVDGAVPAAAWRFAAGADGRPEVRGGDGPCFSLTHCRGLVACAVGPAAPLGIDAEAASRALARPEALAARMAPAERDQLAACADASARRAMLLRLWTLKEAFGKALGLGLRLSLDATAFVLAPTLVADLAGAGQDARAWRFTEWRLATGHLVALAHAASTAPGPLRGWPGHLGATRQLP